MAKKNRGGNPTVSAKKENIEKLKEKLKAEKVKGAEEQWKDLLATMTEEEAKDFVAKVDLLIREQDIQERESAVKSIQDEFAGIEQELDRRDGEQNVNAEFKCLKTDGVQCPQTAGESGKLYGLAIFIKSILH